MDEFIPFGEEPIEEDATFASMPKAVAAACASNGAFELVERRRWESTDTGPCDVLVVECSNDQVPTRNTVGIRVRERLALVLPRDPSNPPQVRALRKAFPLVMHLNRVPEGEPASLCLYFEPWANVRRSWTPQRFLQRLLFWLTETSKGTLHRPNQPVEAMYLESSVDVVLPPGASDHLDSKTSTLQPFSFIPRDDKRATLRLKAVSLAEARAEVPQVALLRIMAGAVVHSGIEAFPNTLGEIVDKFAARGSSLLPLLSAEVKKIASGHATSRVQGQTCLLLLGIPIKRSADGGTERTDIRGFKLLCDFCQLGVDIEALSESGDGKFYPATLLGDTGIPAKDDWRQIQVVPLAVKEEATRAFARRASGVHDAGAAERRLLAGTGALGSQLADLWSRCGWGQWTLVDPDVVEPHNLVRHVAKNAHIGWHKAVATKRCTDASFPSEQQATVAIHENILATAHQQLTECISAATLLVDATTTLEVPRELSQRAGVPRCVSVFITPSGKASVMLMEGADRSVRLDELEAQYYGAVIASDWGAEHLVGHNGDLWVGAGCRDISLVISNESVLLHASILARQIRLLSALTLPHLRIWIVDENDGAVGVVDISVRNPIRETRGEWTIVSHEGIADKLKRLRKTRLPEETGGVIVGYVDQPTKKIFIVDVLPAPADSEGSRTGFVRGIEGLEDAMKGIQRRTANIVGYVGEWHSHPPLNSPNPSSDDVKLLGYCARTMALDGDPAVMVIVGTDGEISYSVGAKAD